MPKPIVTTGKRLARYFMTGLLVVLPVVLTIAIVAWVGSFLKQFLGPGTILGRTLASVGLRLGTEGTVAYLIGIFFVAVALVGLGLMAELGAKRYLHGLMDGLMTRIPIVNSVYGSLKQLVQLFDASDDTKLKAMSVVFCHFGGNGVAGVLALMPSPAKLPIDGQDYQVVIIPTAPVPFGGGLVFVRADLVRPMDMTVDQLISIYVSMGVTTADLFPTAKRNLPDSS